MGSFQGFTQETFSFLSELSQPRDKQWFSKNRKRYETYLVKPLKDLVAEMAPTLIELNDAFEVSPHTNKTLTRINRDMRFARGQSPYKDHMLILFYRVGRKKEDAQLFFGVHPNQVWSGLYISPQRFDENSPIQKFVESNPGQLPRISKACGVDARYRLCVCEKYGQITTHLPGACDQDYLQKSHLVILHTLEPDDVIGQGAAITADFKQTIKDLYPLWTLYSGS